MPTKVVQVKNAVGAFILQNMHPLFPQGTSGFSCTSSLMRRRRKRLSKLAINVGILAASTEGGHASNGQRSCFSAKRREQQPSTNKVAVHRTLRDPTSPAYTGTDFLLLRLRMPRAGQGI